MQPHRVFPFSVLLSAPEAVVEAPFQGTIPGVQVQPAHLQCPVHSQAARNRSYLTGLFYPPPVKSTLSMKEANLLFRALICSRSWARSFWILGFSSTLRGARRLLLMVT